MAIKYKALFYISTTYYTIIFQIILIYSYSFLELGGNSVAAVAASIVLQKDRFPVTVAELLSDRIKTSDSGSGG